MDTELAALRQEYRRQSLDEELLAGDPISQFKTWFSEALKAGVIEPNAMTLATVADSGQPSARIVLLKDVSEEGFTFFTNYCSRKAKELKHQGRAALVFWWQELERQVRVEGSVRRVSDEESDEYFASRPRASKLGAWASPQSEKVDGREALEQRLAKVTEQFEGADIPRPSFWGGYRVRPVAIEFWQGGEGRLHDRLRWSKGDAGDWQVHRLGP